MQPYCPTSSCMYGWFVPLCCCVYRLCTLTEWHKSQNTDIDSTTVFCVGAGAKGCMQGTVWMNKIICESMLHLVEQAKYVEGVLQRVKGVDPVCIEGNICKGGLG